MKIFTPNSETDSRITRLIRSFRKQMNGETADQMEKRGIHYRLNFGIGLVHLREKAKSLPPDMELAERLWYREIRETMILATLIAPKEQMTFEKGIEWAGLVNNCELVEQASLNIFSKTKAAGRLAENWLENEHTYLNALGFYTLGWMFRFQETDNELLKSGLKFANSANEDGPFCFYRGIAHFIRQMLRVKPETKELCEQLVAGYEKRKSPNFSWLASEIKDEIEFL